MIFPFWWKTDNIKNIPTWFLKIDFISQSSFRFLVKLFPTLRMPGTRGAYSLPHRSLYRHVTNSSPIYTQVCSWWNTLIHHPLVQTRTLGIGNRLSASYLMPFCPFTDKVSNTDRWLLWKKRHIQLQFWLRCKMSNFFISDRQNGQFWVPQPNSPLLPSGLLNLPYFSLIGLYHFLTYTTDYLSHHFQESRISFCPWQRSNT